MDLRKISTYFVSWIILILPVLISMLVNSSGTPWGLLLTYTGLGIVLIFLQRKNFQEKDELNEEIVTQNEYIKKILEDARKLKAAPKQTGEIFDPNLGFRVYHSGFLNLRLLEECERSRRYQRPFSCLVIFIDEYAELLKKHPDLNPQTLALEFARFIKQNLRWVDIVIRKADDHLIAILPETGSTGARVTAERLRFKMEHTSLSIEHLLIRVTVTINFLTYDRMIHLGNEQVIQALEQMAIEAKQKGPNRVLVLNE